MKRRVYCTGCVNRSLKPLSHINVVSNNTSFLLLLVIEDSTDNNVLWTTDEQVTYKINPFILYNDWRRKYFPSNFGQFINIYSEILSRIHSYIRYGLAYIYFKFNTTDFLKTISSIDIFYITEIFSYLSKPLTFN